MQTARSKDGTTIAFDRVGDGPPLVIVGGAFSYRRFKGFVQLAELLAADFTVVNYDRRGRGDSGDTAPYAVEREIEDLRAVIDAGGGSASVFGMSSGAVLAMRAAVRGVRIDRLAVYEPPFLVERGARMPPRDFDERLDEMVAAGRRGEAARYFMTKGMGVPAAIVAMMRMTPVWPKLKATSHTLPYEYAVMGDTMSGEPLAQEPWASVTAPTLVLGGSKSPEPLRRATEATAKALPNAKLRVLDRQSHNVRMKALAPVLAEFFRGAGRPTRAEPVPVVETVHAR